ncbi:MAG: hypothetical protein JWN81_106, partial [Solirubrobacterales bacterium]|nr:hypothetical protein [Solirubrobacterales bacterium]
MKKLLGLACVACVAGGAVALERPSAGQPTCVTGFRAGIAGQPGALFNPGDGRIWFSQVRQDRTGYFDPKTRRATEIQLP